MINDRPAASTRNTLRGAANINLNLRLSKTFAFGPQQQTTGDGMPRFRGGPPGGGRGGPGGPGMMMMDGGTNRYKMEFYVQAFNLLNRTNFQNFVGNLTLGLLRHRALVGTRQAHRGGDQLRVLKPEGSRQVAGFGGFGSEVRGSKVGLSSSELPTLSHLTNPPNLQAVSTRAP